MDGAASLFRWSSVPGTAIVITTTAAATATLLLFAKSALWPRWSRILPNPLKTGVSKGQMEKLVYQPDALPGARDVETPYGSIRVYEFGPEDGEKVIFVHGISTPCVTLSHIAHGLVRRGCRVMLFDLFGRGFSDGVGDLPHDARLFTSQMLFVLASSPLSWTGSNQLRVVGYSLGGSIAIHFANTFPHLVSSLVLLAPAGIINAAKFGIVNQIVFQSGLIPERILAYLTSIRLQQPIAAPKAKATATTQAVKVAVAEAADLSKTDEELLPLEHRVLAYVRWMVVHHDGFIPAFMSSIRFSPLTGQHDSWRLLAKRKPGSTMILLAEDDEIINRDDCEQDGLPLVGGKDNVVWKVLPGSHDFVMSHSDQILREIDEFWDMKVL